MRDAKRNLVDTKLQKQVSLVGQAVADHGDKALHRFTEKFDKTSLSSFFVSDQELNDASKSVPNELKKAIKVAKRNIKQYHKHQYTYLKQTPIYTSVGIKCYRKFSAIESVGIYIPGGSAPLFSSVLMTVIPARIAGCKKIIICTPPNQEGKIAPSILFAAKLCGCTQVYKLGGAQAIFAMAYGTKSIPSVYKIVGPGNAYVNEAKKQISTFVPIDMPAGPSEVMIIADETQAINVIARDMLSQLEHDVNSIAVLLAFRQSTIRAVMKNVKEMALESPRKEILCYSLQNIKTIKVRSHLEAIHICNQYAPEHLIISTRKAEAIAKGITNAGSVFIGKYAAESIGDYASGTNHTLPTQGYAKNYSGLSVESFGKWTSFQKISKKGFQKIAPTVKLMSQYESLWEHRNAIIEREQL